WRRCASLKYSRYSPSSRLAIRAPRSAIWSLFNVDRPLAPAMPFATSFYADRRLMITRGWGHITLAEVRAYQQELGQRPEFDPTWAHVFDGRDAVQFDLATDEIRQL